jgi:ABC-type transport system involved in multi-copper enzyme maturation permease subunit
VSKLFNLLKYELYKIYSKKSVLISMIALIVLMTLSAIIPASSNKAIEAKNLVKEYYKTGGNVTKLNEIKEEEKQELANYTNIFDLESEKTNYAEIVAGLQKLSSETKHNGDTGYGYKSVRMRINMLKKVDMKGKLYYCGPWGNIQGITTSKGTIVFLLLCLCLGLSGVFSEEYSQGVDALILSSKHGKKTIISAKILASAIYSLSITLILGATVTVSSILAYGNLEGYNSPIQMLKMYFGSPYNLNFLQLSLLKFLMMLIGSLACGLLILVCSSRIKYTLGAFFISLGAVFVPSYLVENMGMNSLKLLNAYGYFLSPEALLENFNTFGIFGIPVLDLVVYGIVLILFSTISICITKRSFRNHQVVN